MIDRKLIVSKWLVCSYKLFCCSINLTFEVIYSKIRVNGHLFLIAAWNNQKFLAHIYLYQIWWANQTSIWRSVLHKGHISSLPSLASQAWLNSFGYFILFILIAALTTLRLSFDGKIVLFTIFYIRNSRVCFIYWPRRIPVLFPQLLHDFNYTITAWNVPYILIFCIYYYMEDVCFNAL